MILKVKKWSLGQTCEFQLSTWKFSYGRFRLFFRSADSVVNNKFNFHNKQMATSWHPWAKVSTNQNVIILRISKRRRICTQSPRLPTDRFWLIHNTQKTLYTSCEHRHQPTTFFWMQTFLESTILYWDHSIFGVTVLFVLYTTIIIFLNILVLVIIII